MFERSAGLLKRMSSAQSAERVATADRLIAIGEFTCQRIEDDRRAWTADIDHSVPYPLGSTHPSNNVCLLPVATAAATVNVTAPIDAGSKGAVRE